MRQNRQMTFWVWISVAVLLLLIGGLPGLTLRSNALLAAPAESLAGEILHALRLASLMILPLFVVFVLLFVPALRSRQTLVAVLAIGLLLLALAWGLSNLPAGPIELPEQTGDFTGQEEGETAVDDPPPITFPELEPTPEVPGWLTPVVSFGLVLLLLAGLALAVQWRRSAPPPPSLLQQLSDEAQGAAEALQGGADIRNVILRCYAEMGRVVGEAHGVRRQQAMTPREFEAQLAALGLPPGPVATLTGLFELVRYGDLAADGEAESRATASLAAIARACQELA